MLKLSAHPSAPAWLDLMPGVRVQMRPATPAAMIIARREAGKVFRAEGADDDPDTGTKATVALVGALARFAISDWSGVGNAEGEPVPVTAENVDALMQIWPCYDAFDQQYVGPILTGETEKNG
ncbi:hypothetical protein G3T14_23495 [Methylobacterium sp. BTF04]|uniref:hypothetical protein n=1 Tax=Methylobacterium sp. BTF04 TaxID=2708300 RepID=UPI0013D56836|nr:hypothetical protein [Methylobacterium sp. BTF04]NEU15012.1 hypothetical protein [Methylobacterium sp. BTF04]